MKPKQASRLAVIGILLNVFPYLLGLLGEFDNKILLEYSLMITGNVLMILFFFTVLTSLNSKSDLMKFGILGLIGYLGMVILNLLNMIINASCIIAAKAPGIQLSIMSIILVNSGIGAFLKLIPDALILLSFIFLYRGLDKKSFLKRISILAIAGQCLLFVKLIFGILYWGFNYFELYDVIGKAALNAMGDFTAMFEILSFILTGTFFVILVRTLNSNDRETMYINIL